MLMLTSHSLEKGMSFDNKKEGWGREKVLSLCNLLSNYLERYSVTEQAKNVLNILANYRNDDYSSKSDEVINRVDSLLLKYKNEIDVKAAGVKNVEKRDSFNIKEIEEFYKTRSSVRFYSDEPLTKEEIQKAMDIAYTTPTACNRQSSKVYCISNNELRNSILDLQMGNQGWADKAPAMFIITGSLSSFGDYYERYQVFIDGGLFAMNFVMGLHAYNIASCFKMFVRDYKLQDKICSLCGIPNNEVPIVLIMAGHYRDDAVKDPVSHRFKDKLVFVS